ncbi:MAG: hypothetical protein IMW98_03630 [Firmicutes bacterium]|nr:hypothetical protein [Bacillota bacterium]
MASRRDKLNAILQLALRVPPDPALHLLLGFFAGNLERVHFVRSLEGAEVAVRLAFGRRQVWPSSPFQAVVRNVPVPLPAALISALAETDDPIAVQVELDGIEGAVWYRKVLHEDLAEATVPPRERAKEAMEELRARIDRALDVYRECRDLMERGDPDRKKELEFFMNLAREEIGALSAELERLKVSLETGEA